MEIKEMSPTIRVASGDTVDLPITYVNAMNINANVVDFQFVFANQIVDNQKQEIVIKELQRIVMSPQHAKVMLNLLRGQVEGYETKFGTINIPPVEEKNG
jgi:hypothetical protein